MFGHTGAVKALTSEHDWKTLVSHLPADYEQLAIEHRLLVDGAEDPRGSGEDRGPPPNVFAK